MTSLIAQSGRFGIGSDVISVAMSVAVLFAVDVDVACCFSMHASVFFVSLNYIKLGDHFVFLR